MLIKKLLPNVCYISPRFVVDGEGSGTVFNGPKQLIDLMYTRANKMVAGRGDIYPISINKYIFI